MIYCKREHCFITPKPTHKGYLYLQVDGKQEAFHRYIWEQFHETSLNSHQQIDHKDRNPGNNSIDNLRLVTNQQNSQNRRCRKDNKSGIKGVAMTQNNKFKSFITVNGVREHLGVFETACQAKEARLQRIFELNQEGHIFNE